MKKESRDHRRPVRISVLAATAALLAPISATAVLHEQPKTFRGIRSSGMGGVMTTTGNYSEALFGNPARHSEVDTWKLTMLEALGEVNTNLMSDEAELSKFRDASGQNAIASASQIVGRNEHARLQLMSAFYDPTLIGDLGFAVGMIVAAQANLLMNYTTDLDNQIIMDVGPNFGFSHPFFDNTLTVGLNIHMLYRVASEGTVSSLTFLNGGKLSLREFGHQGFGVDADLGAYYHIPWEIPFMRISLGASINGLVKTHYREGNPEFFAVNGSNPVNNDRLFNAGVRFDFPDTWIFRAPLFALEIQDTGDSQKRISFAKKTHLGAEGKLSRVFSLRLGLNQGYITAGLGIDLPVVKIDFATYGEELGSNAGLMQDRRIALRLAFEL